MLDLLKEKAKELGFKVEIYFENEEAKKLFEEKSSEDVEELIKFSLCFKGMDLLYLIINDQGLISILSDRDFLDWQKKPKSEREWYHFNDKIPSNSALLVFLNNRISSQNYFKPLSVNGYEKGIENF